MQYFVNLITLLLLLATFGFGAMLLDPDKNRQVRLDELNADEPKRLKKIVSQARSKNKAIVYYSINHLSQKEMLHVADKLNKRQLEKWYKHHLLANKYTFSTHTQSMIYRKINSFSGT